MMINSLKKHFLLEIETLKHLILKKMFFFLLIDLAKKPARVFSSTQDRLFTKGGKEQKKQTEKCRKTTVLLFILLLRSGGAESDNARVCCSHFVKLMRLCVCNITNLFLYPVRLKLVWFLCFGRVWASPEQQYESFMGQIRPIPAVS